MRGDLIETYKIIKGFVNYGQLVILMSLLIIHSDQRMTSLIIESSNIGISCHYEIQQVSTPLRLVLASLSYLNLIRLIHSGNYRKKSLIE